MVNQLRQQDARVAALLEKYKAALLERVLSEHHPREFRFVDITKAAIDTGVSITAERYATICNRTSVYYLDFSPQSQNVTTWRARGRGQCYG